MQYRKSTRLYPGFKPRSLPTRMKRIHRQEEPNPTALLMLAIAWCWNERKYELENAT